ncbi:hypothetical protein [Sneathiella limimaris]|uniref:hypothetical protein n=1 Tax=Sneathiella limimaris TaxID=1964213 RepID=UPI00146E99DF|nr:hypothetical protein [Sneathiella limimaris]
MLLRKRISGIVTDSAQRELMEPEIYGLKEQKLDAVYTYTYLHKDKKAYEPIISEIFRKYKALGCLLDSAEGIRETCLMTN